MFTFLFIYTVDVSNTCILYCIGYMKLHLVYYSRGFLNVREKGANVDRVQLFMVYQITYNYTLCYGIIHKPSCAFPSHTSQTLIIVYKMQF